MGIIKPLLLLCFLFASKLLSAQLPSDFYDQVVTGEFTFPLGVAFDESGRMFVWEKEGKVYLVDSLGNRIPEPLIDISEEVTNWKDHGLMGFALDPGFLTNGHFYLLYALDLHHYHYYGTNEYHPDSTVTWQPTIGRIARYTADPDSGFNTAMPGSRKILLGETLDDGIPLLYEFHGLGSLVVGTDGTLLISSGDGTANSGTDTGGDEFGTYVTLALEAGILTPDQDVGSYRSQYLANLNGKILRIDPETGDGLPSNPFYNPAEPRAARSRVWAYGLRNPYRITLRPETGSHFPQDGEPGVIFAGDVGNGRWEEIDVVIQGGKNFGWPVFEGMHLNWAFHLADAPFNRIFSNPLFGQGNCEQEFFTFRQLVAEPVSTTLPNFSNPCDSLQPIPPQAFPSVASLPAIAWSNRRWNPPTRAEVSFYDDQGDLVRVEVEDPLAPVGGENFDGFSSLAGVFYTGDLFPEAYHDKYFGVDFSGWIKVFDFGENNQLTAVEDFHNDVKDIIHLAFNPSDESLYYVNLQGEVRKITDGGNPPPVPVLGANQFYGPAPLNVQFDASGSYDSNLPIVAYEWDFGDGTSSTEIAPLHTFTTSDNGPASFQVRLTVTDSLGASATESRIISLNNTPPQVDITSFEHGDLYPMHATTLLMLAAQVSDTEHAEEELGYEWRTFLHHNDHFHPEPAIHESRSYALISPLGCTDEELYWYRIELTVTDPEGLSTTVSQNIYPYCEEDFIEWTELKAEPDNGQNRLEWATLTENELNRFEVQRSQDFFHFKTIGIVEPKGGGLNYEWYDETPITGSNVYRIKVLNLERAYTYSNLASANYPQQADVKVFPNPAKSFFRIELKSANSETVYFELFSPTGIRILRTSWPGSVIDPFLKTVLTQGLSSGLYYYKVVNGAEEKVGSLLIAK